MTFEQKTKKPLELHAAEEDRPEVAAAPAPAMKGIGPLALVVERARRVKASGSQNQGQDWAAVAQKLAAQHQALGSRATRHDLVLALRRIPDQSVRESLIGQLGGSDAEGLRAALTGRAGKGSAPASAPAGSGVGGAASHGDGHGHAHLADEQHEAELQAAPLDDTSDPDHIGEDKRRSIREETERSQVAKMTDRKPDEQLKGLGLSQTSLTGMSGEDLDLLMKSAESWNTDPDGRSHGVISTQDHARGKGGSAKQERLKKLGEYTGRGSFDGEEPMALHKVTQLLTELTASPMLPPRELGERKLYFFAKDGEQPPYTDSHKGIIIIKSQDKIVSFMHGNFSSYESME